MARRAAFKALLVRGSQNKAEDPSVQAAEKNYEYSNAKSKIPKEAYETKNNNEETMDGTKLKKLDDLYFAYNYDVGTSGPYINYREVFARFELNPGTYVIIPATFEPNCPGKFMIRVYNSCSECDVKQL